MAYSIEIDRDHRIVRFTATEMLNREEFLRCLGDAASRPGFEADFGHLVDLRQIEDLQASMGDFEQRINADMRLVGSWPAFRIALVCSSDLIYGIARMYQSLMGAAHVEVEIFSDIDEAERWLVTGGSGA
ncbi:MAG: hypothetical protein GC159_18790 [Phycisphaera sp.]|nr:hypothetical protein [Phycisphaera sp.]